MTTTPRSHGAARLLLLPLLAAASAGAGAATAHDVEFVLTGLRNDVGSVQAVLCAAGEAYPNGCGRAQKVKAEAGSVGVVFKDVPPGSYAFAAFHDEDGDGRLRMAKGRPAEGFAFGNDAFGASGTPSFQAASVVVGGATKRVVKVRYMR